MMVYLDLLLGFLKVGCFSFGGAYGAIPLIRDVVLSYGWMDDQQLTYLIAVSESTPGSIMVNLATFVGSTVAGLPGSILATLAVALPPFLVILLLMVALKTALKNRHVQATLDGLKPSIAGIILATGLYMMVTSCLSAGPRLDYQSLLVTALLAGASLVYGRVRKKPLSPIGLICLAAALGMVIY